MDPCSTSSSRRRRRPAMRPCAPRSGPRTLLRFSSPRAQGRELEAGTVAPLVAAAQAQGAAALVEGDARLARTVKADGVHVPWSKTPLAAYTEAREILGARAMIGGDAGRRRHDAMQLGEAGADYIGFGIPAHGGRATAARAGSSSSPGGARSSRSPSSPSTWQRRGGLGARGGRCRLRRRPRAVGANRHGGTELGARDGGRARRQGCARRRRCASPALPLPASDS